MTRRRQIHLAIDANDRGDWRLSAECDDESTEVVVLNPTALFGDTQPTDVLAAWRTTLVAEHLDRCVSCRTARRVSA